MILLDSGRTVERRRTDKVMQGTEIHIMVITSIMTERTTGQHLQESGVTTVGCNSAVTVKKGHW